MKKLGIAYSTFNRMERDLLYLAHALNLKIKYLNANDKTYLFTVFEV